VSKRKREKGERERERNRKEGRKEEREVVGNSKQLTVDDH